VTSRGRPGGLTDLRGNPLDGDAGGSLTWPQVSGDGVAGGDFVTTFAVEASDTTPAVVSLSNVTNLLSAHLAGDFSEYRGW
jgi:hypothetical protein